MYLREILKKFKNGEIGVHEAEKLLKLNAVKEIEELAVIDVSREKRVNKPEVIFAKPKKWRHLKKIILETIKVKKHLIVSGLGRDKAEEIMKEIHKPYLSSFFEEAEILVIKHGDFKVEKRGKVGVLAAGTADIKAAEEARVVAEEMGCETIKKYDVGLSSFFRLLSALKEMVKEGVHVIVAAAGMEGALPSVVASLVDVPVIGLPTSVGYGFRGKGEAALSTMLQSCSLGVAVVNIDNGVNAGVIAALIARK